MLSQDIINKLEGISKRYGAGYHMADNYFYLNSNQNLPAIDREVKSLGLKTKVIQCNYPTGSTYEVRFTQNAFMIYS